MRSPEVLAAPIIGYRVAIRTLFFAPYIQSFLTIHHGLSSFDYGLVQAVYYWTLVIAQFPTGVIADRMGHRGTLAAAAFCNISGCVIFATTSSYSSMLIAQSLFGLTTALVTGVDGALLFAVARRSAQLVSVQLRVLGRLEFATTAALGVVMVISPLMADRWMVAGSDVRMAYWASAAASSVALVLVWHMPRFQAELRSESASAGYRGGSAITARSFLVALYAAMVVLVATRVVPVMFQNIALQAAGIRTDQFGSVVALASAASIVTSLLARRYWRPDRPIRMAGALAATCILPLIAMASSSALVVIGAVAGIAAITPLAITTSRVLTNSVIRDDSQRASLLSFEALAASALFGLVSIGVGYVIDNTSVGYAVICTASMMLVLVIGLFYSDFRYGKRI